MKKLFFFVITVNLSLFAMADIKMPAIFSDNMVLQQDAKLPVWGWAEPNEKIKVSLFSGKNSRTVEAIADSNGKWRLTLPAMKASFDPLTMQIKGKNIVTFKNILIGEVWVCSGQSNMAYKSKKGKKGEIGEKLSEMNMSSIRLFEINSAYAYSPMKKLREKSYSSWKECSSTSAISFSAVGYFFGKEIHGKLKQPVGLIEIAVSSSKIDGWLEPESLNNDFQNLLKEQHRIFEKAKLTQEEKIKCSDPQSSEEYRKGIEKRLPRKYWRHGPGMIYNAMINPVIPFAIKGVIWYQGESDALKAFSYRKRFRALIKGWRKQWGQGDFPFYFVQLPSYSSWIINSVAEVRDSQMSVLDEPNTGMAIAIDLGDPPKYDCHIKNKREVGRRLSLLALQNTYGMKDIIGSGPLYKSMKIDNEKIILEFKNAPKGFLVKGENIKGFLIAGIPAEYEKAPRYDSKKILRYSKQRKFYNAKAEIKGNKIIVWSDKVKKPVAVRYGWKNMPECNIFAKSGLPVAPFRTDDFIAMWK